ncbi:MAG: DUF4215 domain-containing protein, partial [Clostridia bacterium]|nr:DUF4215 domain-containing protein [Deltaproteobacteria bacterium]
MLRAPVVAFILFCSCTASLDVPAGVLINCSSDADCNGSRRCLLDARVCVEPTQSCVVEAAGGFAGVANGSACTLKSGAPGVCFSGECIVSRCGDGATDLVAGEQCDEGAANSDTAPSACRTSCVKAACGDGVVDAGEACDDSNVLSADGCRADCQKLEVCDDGAVDANEDCDDLNANPNDGCDKCTATEWSATRVLGAGGNGSSLSTIAFASSGPLAVDFNGRIYLADRSCRIYLLDPRSDAVTVVAGSGTCGNDINGVPARDANLPVMWAIAIDSRGAIYFSDSINLVRIDPVTGLLETLQSGLVTCYSIAIDADDNIVFSENDRHIVRKRYSDSGFVSDFIGVYNSAGSDFYENAPAGDVKVNQPAGVASDARGWVYVFDSGNSRILSYDPDNDQTHLVAGKATGGGGVSPDGTVASGNFIKPTGNGAKLARRFTGELLFVEQNKIRVVKTDGTLGTLAGNGANGSSGDGGPALAASIQPFELASFPDGRVVFEESPATVGAHVKLRLIANGTINGLVDSTPRAGLTTGQSGTATSVTSLADFEVATNGDVFAALSSPAAIVRVDHVTGDVELYAGLGSSSTSGTLAKDFQFTTPRSVSVLASGDLIVLDSNAARVYRIDGTTKVVSVIAGTGVTGSGGDGGPATAAQFRSLNDLDVAANGDIFIFDGGNKSVRKVTATTGIITRVAGDGANVCTNTAPPSCGDGGPATSAQLGNYDSSQVPNRGWVRVAPNGDLYISDQIYSGST